MRFGVTEGTSTTGVFTATPIRDTPAPDAGLSALPRELAACRQEGGSAAPSNRSRGDNPPMNTHGNEGARALSMLIEGPCRVRFYPQFNAHETILPALLPLVFPVSIGRLDNSCVHRS